MAASFHLWLLCAAICMAPCACGSSPGTDDGGTDEEHATDDDEATDQEADLPDGPPVTPIITRSDFPVLHAGDELTFIGVHFLTPDEGTVAVRFVGAFSSDQTSWYDVDFRVGAIGVSKTRAKLVFQPGFPPDGFGRVLGVFQGTIALINIDAQTRETSSLPVDVELEVGRSLLIHGVRPLGHDCGTAMATRVRAESALEFELEVLGFEQPSPAEPILVTAKWDDGLESTVDALTTFAGAVEIPTPFAWQGPATTLELTAEADPLDVVARRLTFETVERYSIPYAGEVAIVERFGPVRVTDCLGAGSYAYSESSNEGRVRSYTTSGSVSVGVNAISEAFGLSVTAAVSSGAGVGLGVTATVSDGMYGVFFRQTLRLARAAPFLEHDVCGVGAQVGQVMVTDWAWTPGFNQQASACPPYPEPLVSGTGELQMP